MSGSCKHPEPFQMVFSHGIDFFPLIVFPSAGFTPSPKDSHERGKGKGKGRVKEGKRKNRKGTGKGEERDRKGRGKGKTGPCLTQTVFDAKSYRFRFVIVRESCARSFFLEMAAIIKKGL